MANSALHGKLADRLRDWIHETPLSKCDSRADTCPDWPLAHELATMLMNDVIVPLEAQERTATRTVQLPDTVDYEYVKTLEKACGRLGFVLNLAADPVTVVEAAIQKCKEQPDPPAFPSATPKQSDPWKRIEQLEEELRVTRMQRGGQFADYAEAFCAGWNRYRETPEDQRDVADVFARLLMDAYRNSGSQRARRFGNERNVDAALRLGASARSGER